MSQDYSAVVTGSVARAMTLLMVTAYTLSAQSAHPDTMRLRLAREVIHVSGTDSAALHGIENAIPAQRVVSPNVPAAFWDEFLVKARSDFPQLVDSLVPLYASHFSVAELEQLKAFYLTPIGKRLVAEQGSLQQESAKIGRRWGAMTGAKVTADLMERGVSVQP